METQTGSVYYRDDAGNLMLAESFQNEAGVTRTVDTVVEPASEPVAEN